MYIKTSLTWLMSSVHTITDKLYVQSSSRPQINTGLQLLNSNINAQDDLSSTFVIKTINSEMNDISIKIT